MGTLANSEDPDEMLHSVAFHQGSTLFSKKKTIFREKVDFGNSDGIPERFFKKVNFEKNQQITKKQEEF